MLINSLQERPFVRDFQLVINGVYYWLDPSISGNLINFASRVGPIRELM